MRCVFYVSVGIYNISFACLEMHYGVRVLYSQHRHVFRRFHMKCYGTATSNAYSLHLHRADRCGVCARLTWLFLEISTHAH